LLRGEGLGGFVGEEGGWKRPRVFVQFIGHFGNRKLSLPGNSLSIYFFLKADYCYGESKISLWCLCCLLSRPACPHAGKCKGTRGGDLPPENTAGTPSPPQPRVLPGLSTSHPHPHCQRGLLAPLMVGLDDLRGLFQPMIL